MNTHIEKYLEYYKTIQNPGYAVMITGLWGSGKTWFIKKYLESCKDFEQKHLYVSLYGLTSTEEIEYEIFKQLHPFLSSKSVAIVSKIFKGALKGVIKIDLDDDTSTTVNTQIPDIKIPEYLTNTKGFVLVFDDLERCGIAINNLLGYINYFVENNGYNAILVANEDEIKESQNYSRTKEKLIGVTFEVNSNIDDAIKHFISNIENQDASKTLSANIDIIKEIHVDSTYKNLRHIKQSILEFQRLFLILNQEHRNSSNLIQHLIKIYFTLSIELKSGNLNKKDIDALYANIITRREEGSPFQLLTKKYPKTPFFDLIFSSEELKNILIKGILNKNEIQKEINESRYFRNENTPNWVRLWSFYELDDDDFVSLSTSVIDDFKNFTYEEIGEIQHVFGILLQLLELRLISTNKNELLLNAKSNINNILSKSARPIDEWYDFKVSEFWQGKGFHKRDDPLFIKLTNHIKRELKTHFEKNVTNIENNILSNLENNPDQLMQDLMPTNSGKCPYYDKPILKYVSPKEFAKKYLLSSGYNQEMIRTIFTNRYKYDLYNKSLVDELKWLRLFKSELKKQIKPYSVSALRIKYLTDIIDESIESLMKISKKSS
jgi:KAP family P-loop domain.